MTFDQALPGLWLPAAAESNIAFDVNAPPTAEEALWRADLPSDTDLAQQELNARTAQLSRFDTSLAIAGQRLEQFGDRIARGAGSASFATEVLATPEQELLNWLGEVQGRAVASYGIGEDWAAGWNAATEQLQAMVERAINLVVYYARVETNVGGERLGATTGSWTGDMDTAWHAELTPEQAALHQRTLLLALESRDAYLRAFALASRGAVMLAALPALLAAPGGALVAIPAAWKFIQDVLQELEK